jgi:predicted amidophosphoribosyltransferase
VRCGRPVEGLKQFCDECSALQQQPIFSPAPASGTAPPSASATARASGPVNCPNCGGTVPEFAIYCPDCGSAVGTMLTATKKEFAGFWMRFLASIVDSIIVGWLISGGVSH